MFSKNKTTKKELEDEIVNGEREIISLGDELIIFLQESEELPLYKKRSHNPIDNHTLLCDSHGLYYTT